MGVCGVFPYIRLPGFNNNLCEVIYIKVGMSRLHHGTLVVSTFLSLNPAPVGCSR